MLSKQIHKKVEIPGDYQYQALKKGFVVQRFFHYLKTVTIQNLALPNSSMVVLDVGCGSGVVSNFLAQHARFVHAVDSNKPAIKFAQNKFQRDNLKFYSGFVEEIDFVNDMFDVIYCLEFIEHLYWPKVIDLFHLLTRFLKPGGRFFLTTPNYHSPWPIIEKAMDLLRLAPKMAAEQHISKPTKRKLECLATSCGLEPVVINRDFGIALFLSIFGWKFAEKVKQFEDMIGSPLGSHLCAVFKKP
jgi:2-polyprenyl-3-methyl-5-hydroxy-6-metoxy-1,4-benzoquinol methylase